MKKRYFTVIIFCFLTILLGCGQQGSADKTAETGKFDFKRYDNKDITEFLDDNTLSMDDFTDEGMGHYKSNHKIPFMDTTADYSLICDGDNKIQMISVVLQEEDNKSSEDFEMIQTYRDIYNGSGKVQYMYDLEEYQGMPNVNTYKTADEFDAAIQNTKNEPETEQDAHFFSLRGIWNLEDGTQVDMKYTLRFDDGQSGIIFQYCNSSSPLAVSFDHTAK